MQITLRVLYTSCSEHWVKKKKERERNEWRRGRVREMNQSKNMRQKNQPKDKTIILIYLRVRIHWDKGLPKKKRRTLTTKETVLIILDSHDHRGTRGTIMWSVTLKKTTAEAGLKKWNLSTLILLCLSYWLAQLICPFCGTNLPFKQIRLTAFAAVVFLNITDHVNVPLISLIVGMWLGIRFLYKNT